MVGYGDIPTYDNRHEGRFKSADTIRRGAGTVPVQSILDGILAVPRFRQKHSATAEKPRIAMRRSVSTVLINLRIQSALILQNAWIRGSNELLPNYEISVEPNGVQNGRCRCD